MTKKIKRTAAALAVAAGLATGLVACSDDATVASANLSKAADNFEIDRRVVFFNGITDNYLLEIEGRCAVENKDIKLDVTCKVGENEYKKHFLGLSDNVSYFVEQLEVADVSVYNYRVTFKPDEIIPHIDMRTQLDGTADEE